MFCILELQYCVMIFLCDTSVPLYCRVLSSIYELPLTERSAAPSTPSKFVQEGPAALEERRACSVHIVPIMRASAASTHATTPQLSPEPLPPALT